MAGSTKIESGLVDGLILARLGERLMGQRIVRGLTQAQLAAEAGVAKRTVERVEAGESIQLLTLIRLCRVLVLLEGIDLWLPEPRPSPMALLKESKASKKTAQKAKQRVRKRAASATGKSLSGKTQPGKWEWTE